MCAKRGLRWGSGEKANEFVPNFDIFEEGVVIIHEMRPNGMRLAYMVFSYTGDGVPIIDYKDFVDEEAPACYQITITCDGIVTTATMVINGKKIKTAIARQNPEDKFDWRKGAKVAFDLKAAVKPPWPCTAWPRPRRWAAYARLLTRSNPKCGK